MNPVQFPGGKRKMSGTLLKAASGIGGDKRILSGTQHQFQYHRDTAPGTQRMTGSEQIFSRSQFF
jgi:hypothetical protein